MRRINELDVDTSNKIAAGEVVERPFSVVKELIENSIDAEAKNITVEIIDGGQKLIKVTDDGTGIHPDDIKKAFLPHATSKISSIEDIFNINTLGFRGEALPSIASISQVLLRSKSREYETGREILIEGGAILEEKPSACNNGTSIEVRDIFYNVPARLKFMKAPQREAALISDIISRLALCNPNISFKLISNGKVVLSTYSSNNMMDTIRNIYGKSISDNIWYFEKHADTCSIYGYIGNAEVSRGSRNNQSIFVNKRYIKSKLITTAVENAFKSFLTINKYPFFIVFIDIYPELIDVNIHPTKSEIKFKDDRDAFKGVFDAVHNAIRHGMFSDFHIPEENSTQEHFHFSPESPMEKTAVIELPIDIFGTGHENKNILNFNNVSDDKVSLSNNDFSINKSSDYIKEVTYDSNAKDESTSLEIHENKLHEDKLRDQTSYCLSPSGENAGASISKFPSLRLIGQLFNTYILAEGPDGLYSIDQHAAHEKILFEKYMKNIKLQQVVSQLLILPVVIELSSEDFLVYIENNNIFMNAGFNIEVFGENTINIREIPIFLGKIYTKSLFLETLDNLKAMGSGESTEVKYDVIARHACKSAVKANNTLSDLEMKALIEALRFIDDPFTCPHGRPTIIKITQNELEKRFKRIQ